MPGQSSSEAETVSVNALISDVIGFVSLEKSFAACSIKTKLLAEDDAIVADKDALAAGFDQLSVQRS